MVSILQLKGRDCQNALKEQDSTIFYPQEMHFKYKNTNELKAGDGKDNANTIQIKAEVAIFKISNIVDFRTRNITRDKKGYFIMIKDSLKGHNNSKCLWP